MKILKTYPSLIIVVLYPQYKLEYFKTANWEQKWIDVAEKIL